MIAKCPECGLPMEHDEGMSYNCENCGIRWTGHNLKLHREVCEMQEERIEQRKKYREKIRKYEQLSIKDKILVELGLKDVE